MSEPSPHAPTGNGTTQSERQAVNDEMARTAFQRKVVTRAAAEEVLAEAIEFFRARGYRVGRTGRPNQVYVLGGREGILPRVTAEVSVQPNVGRGRVSMVTISGFGPRLREHLQAFAEHVRAGRRGG
jgi:hypothetical protein